MISDILNCPLSTRHSMRSWNAGSSSCWHSLSSLQKLSLKDCPQLLFHKDGLPSNLLELEICKYSQLTPQVNWGLQRLTSLTEFKIKGGCQDVESFPEEHLLPSHLPLLKLNIFQISSLRTVEGFNYLAHKIVHPSLPSAPIYSTRRVSTFSFSYRIRDRRLPGHPILRARGASTSFIA